MVELLLIWNKPNQALTPATYFWSYPEHALMQRGQTLVREAHLPLLFCLSRALERKLSLEIELWNSLPKKLINGERGNDAIQSKISFSLCTELF